MTDATLRGSSAVTCIAVLTAWAFRTALAGQPAFRGFDV
jgi:hypothetical protein